METHAHHLHKAPGNKFWHFINGTDRMRLSADNLILLIQKEYHLE